jgi:histone H3/H4
MSKAHRLGFAGILAVLIMAGAEALGAAPDPPAAKQATPSDAHVLFMVNMGRFYTRVPLPERRRDRQVIVAALRTHLDAFAVQLLREAAGNADHAGRPSIDRDDANRAVQRLLPHQIDRVEDVHFFPGLASEEEVVIEGYDCDSFRSSGFHLESLERGLNRASDEAPRPDSFAEEVFNDAIARYGVLLLRLAGEIAVQDTTNVRVAIDDLARSAERIRERANRHAKGPATSQQGHLRKAASAERNESSGREAATAEDPSAIPETFFSDVTDLTGIHFVHRSSKWLGEFRHTVVKTFPTFSGGGVAAEDVNGDSHIDLLFVGGIGNALLVNDGHGNFTDVTEQAGIAWSRPDGSHGEARNPIIADFDNDGRQDILITYANEDHRLFQNIDNKHFADVSSASGLGGQGLIGGPATAFDFDGDGLLDLYIAHIGDYLNGSAPSFTGDSQNALPNRLFRNRGGMRFEDVTQGSGVADTGWTQAVTHVDFDRDGRQDIIVANDFGRNAFLRNLGGGKFEDVALALGVTKINHSMNVGITDHNADGYPDIYIANLATLMKDGQYVFPDVNLPSEFDRSVLDDMTIHESDVLYVSRVEGGRLAGYEPSESVERGSTSTGWAWDAEFFDFDHDGDDDLYLVNGKSDYNTMPLVYRQPGADNRITRFLLTHNQETNVFFTNDGGVLKNTSSSSGADFKGNSRSTAYLDIDEDGDLDIAINNFHAPATILRNNSQRNGLNWLKIRLIGDPTQGSNRDAIGARIRVTAGEDLHVSREIQGGSGYLSMNPKQQHFGLANADSADLLIIWPNGERQRLEGLAANRAYLIHQGAEQCAVRSYAKHSAESVSKAQGPKMECLQLPE